LLYHFYSNILSIILNITLLLIYTHSYINQPSFTYYQKKIIHPKLAKQNQKKKKKKKERFGQKITKKKKEKD
jgi:p-aminobenzoyl-glutamate transporter AbgT